MIMPMIVRAMLKDVAGISIAVQEVNKSVQEISTEEQNG